MGNLILLSAIAVFTLFGVLQFYRMAEYLYDIKQHLYTISKRI